MLFLPSSNSSLAHPVWLALIYWTDRSYTAVIHGHKADLVPHSDSRDLPSDKLASQEYNYALRYIHRNNDASKQGYPNNY